MNSPLNLVLVGDVMLGRLVNERLRDHHPESVWGDTLPLFHQADFRACNLECVITDHGSPWARSPKAFHFRSDGANIAVLKAAQFDVISLANNHTLDFNHRGLVDMLKSLDAAHIARCGAGLNLEEAARLSITEVQGCRIGFLSFTDNEPSWEAGDDHPGIYHVPVDKPDERTADLISRVRKVSGRVDVLIVSAHWGGNWGCHPPPSHTALAHDLVRAGADIIFGHSPHVSRGVEIYEDALILYSTGDFVDDYVVDPVERNDRSWVFKIKIENKQVSSLHLHPIVIHQCQASLAKPDLAGEMISGMKELCALLGTESSPGFGGNHLVINARQNTGVYLEPQVAGIA
jgi:poly-gamma-glutamate capsule biosynthesis protein CapA/YwtB (metallophosphatase superfamily)